MILGVGIDLCHIERIRRSIRRYGDLWIDHLFTADERQLCAAYPDPVVAYARGFCGKEACAKALGTGVADGIDWREIEVLQAVHLSVRVSGAVRDRLSTLTPLGHEAIFMISCGDDRHLAQACVILSVEPKQLGRPA